LIEILTEAAQDVPKELYDMAERFEARKEKERRGGGHRGNRFKKF
jgi:hypothetical protein